MTVSELINELSECSPDDIVVMSKDGEGNGFSPLADIDRDRNYEADSTWSGEIGFRKLTPELRKQGYSEDDVLEGKPCVVLCPTN